MKKQKDTKKDRKIINAVIIFSILGIILMIRMFAYTNKDFNTISSQKAKEMMDNGNVVVVDVREYSEYVQGHIPNAILLPLGDIDSKASAVLPDKDAIILVYCRSGNRSVSGAKALVKLGYTNVYEMGGISSWQSKGYEVVQ